MLVTWDFVVLTSQSKIIFSLHSYRLLVLVDNLSFGFGLAVATKFPKVGLPGLQLFDNLSLFVICNR